MRQALSIIGFGLVFIGQFGLTAEAQMLSSLAKLRTIKMRLVAQDLDGRDYEWYQSKLLPCLNQKASARGSYCEDRLLAERIGHYMKMDTFVRRGMEFTNNLLALSPTSIPLESIQNESADLTDETSDDVKFSRTKYNRDALAGLSRDIFSKNQSWSRFFTAGDFAASELEYYNHFLASPPQPKSTPGAVIVKIENPDVAAGFMITPRFLSRYFNNPVNEGRKRAAGIMRIALCDSMFPAIERGEEHKVMEAEIALGKNLGAQTQIDGANLHGVRRDCAQCHVYRGLDHIAWTFRSTELALSPRPAKGRFTYLRKNGELVDIEVRGIGHLARVISEQPEFFACQVRHFWSRFVGPVRYLDEFPQIENELVSAYKRVDGRVQDFISYLLLRPEVAMSRLPKAKQDLVFAKAAKVLSSCNQCHQGLVPSFTNLPIVKDGTNLTQHFARRIIERLSLKPLAKSQERTMPPNSSPWQPKDEDLAAVLSWIQAGMPDAQGVKHLTESDIKSLGGNE